VIVIVYENFYELNLVMFQLKTQIGETGDSYSNPMMRNIIDEVEIDNLHIFKDLKMPGTDKWVRFHVRAEGKTTISGLTQDARFIDANLSFENLDITEKNTDDFSENWT